jgi:lysophospholipase L1-like esterase
MMMNILCIAFLLLTFLCPAPAPRPRLVVLGDSIGVGVGASDRARTSYAALLAAQLNLTLDNRAIGGSTIDQQPIPTDLRAGDVVVWLSGYNDMRAGHDPAAYGARLRAAAAAIVAQGAVLYLAGCLSMTDAGYASYGPQWNRGSAALVEQYTAQIASVPGVRHVALDYNPANVDSDLAHPNDAGHAQIAQSFLAASHAPLRAVWERPGVARVSWGGAGCLFHQQTLYRCYDGSRTLLLGSQGPIDAADRVRAGDVFRLARPDGAIEVARLGVVYLPVWR